jgi:lysophospholipase L1-like esterase
MRRSMFTVLCSILLTVVVAVPVAADEPQGSAVLALGDSVAAGEGSTNPDVNGFVPRVQRDLISEDCNDFVAKACPHLEVVNLGAMGGVTSGELVATQLAPAIDEILARQGDTDPNNDVEYIVISIGGNDLFGALHACAEGIGQACIDALTATLTAFEQNLATILGSLHAAAPQAEIAIMTVYNPLGSCVLADLEPLGNIALEGGGVLPGGLNDIIRGVAGVFDRVEVVETFGLLETDDLVGGSDCRHPDDSGHRKIALAFGEALS